MKCWLVATCALVGACGGSDVFLDLGGDTPDLAAPPEDDLRAGAVDLAAARDAAPPDLTKLPPDLAKPSPDLAAGACGTCPAGYSCGVVNGINVCRAPSGVPLFTHVFVIVMENTSYKTLDASSNTPYLHGLKSTGAYGTDYHGVVHPSLPNYVALASGDPQGITCDCNPTGAKCNALTCNALLSSCGCSQPARNIGDDLDAAKLAWRAYGEDMGAACNVTSAGKYAARHVPFLYFDDIGTDAARCAMRVVDLGQFTGDLASANPPAFSFIAPNLVHDMHDPFPAGATNLANGDTWLSQFVPPILQSSAYKDRGLVVIVWDEDDLSGVLAPDDPIPIFVLSPLAKSGGYPSAGRADHYALLATIEDGLGLPRLGKAAQAKPLADYFQ